MWSMHDFPLLKPACSWRRIVSVAADILFRIMRLKILHVIDNKVMPRQLLQFPKSPFFGSLIIVPVFQSSGVSSSSHILWKIWQRILGVSCSSAFSISAQTLSLHSAFPFFWALMASLTSASVIWSRLISRSSAASGMSASLGGSARLKTCWKCSFHLSIFSFSTVIIFPSASFSGRFWFGPVSHFSFLVIW